MAVHGFAIYVCVSPSANYQTTQIVLDISVSPWGQGWVSELGDKNHE